MFNLEGIDHVALAVRDVAHSAAWYVDVLGFERQHEGLWNGVPTFVRKGSTGIALFPAKHPEYERADAGIAILHVALRADRENFLLAQKSLATRGLKFHSEDHGIAHSIYFSDPDGHRLEITTYDVGSGGHP